MADELSESGAPGAGDEASASATDAGGGAKLQTRAEKDAADRAAFLAGDWEDDDAAADSAAAPKKGAPKKPAVADASDEEEDDDRADEEDDADEVDQELDELEDEDEDLEDQDEDDESEQSKVDAKGDPELAKRLSKVQKYEKKIRDQAAARDRQFAQERDTFVAEWKPKIEAYEQFEKLKSRKSDPASLLKAIGYSEDDFEDISKILWGLSKTGSADPKNRDAVARMQRERELRDQNRELEARLAGIEGKLTQAEKDSLASQQAEQYLGRIEKAIGDETPLLRKRMEMSPKSTRKAIARVALQLAEKSGSVVEPKKVARAYEKKLSSAVEQAAKLRDEKPASAGGKPAGKKPAIVVEDKTKRGAGAVAPKNGSNGALIPSRTDMIDRLRKIDRGELDPDHD